MDEKSLWVNGRELNRIIIEKEAREISLSSKECIT